MSTGKEVVAAGFIIFRKIQNEISYLLMHASYENNLWTPPKGHVDPGETEMQAAERETEEEAGLSREHYNTIEGFHKTLRYPVRNKMKRVEYWLAELRDPNTPVKLSDEHREYRWCNFDDTLKYARFPDMQDVYKEVHEFLQKQNT